MDNSARISLLCLAYIVGLVASPFPLWTWGLAILLLLVGYLADRRQVIRLPMVWIITAAVILLNASFYCQWRLPQPTKQDISLFINAIGDQGQTQFSSVRGLVDSYPKLTRTERGQFWLRVNQLSEIQGNSSAPATMRGVEGLLYVTAPLLSTTGLKPGVEVVVIGTLYKPTPSLNPGGLDFADYLARSGCFAGMRAAQLIVLDEEQIRRWDLAKIRQRIVQSQVRWLDVPAGPLVSAMALGGDVVDLPFDLKDWFVRVGLAHALAASGFQVSLILSATIAITQRFLAKSWQFVWGLLALGIFVGLTGLQPSVLRAAVMGVAVLLGLLLDRQIQPLNSLLLAGVLLLAINPIWIWDVGFQLSILATMGLVVSATPIQKRLDWLPPTIAQLVAVPLAATIWTLPIQLWTFKVLPLYSLPANIISSPLVAVISMGGMVSAGLGAIFPPVGSAIAWLLLYPTQFLIWIVHFIATIPGSNMAVGNIALWQLLVLYGLILLVWQIPRWQRRWPWILLTAILLISVPLWITKIQELKITALAATEGQVLVIQKQYQTTLIDSGNSEIARYSVLPFLTHEAVNHLDQAISLQSSQESDRGWQTINNYMSIHKLYTSTSQASPIANSIRLNLNQSVDLSNGKVQLLQIAPPLLTLDIGQQQWLVAGNLRIDQQQELALKISPVQCIYWPGGKLIEQFIKTAQPQVAIASTTNLDPETIQNLEKMGTKVFVTSRDGAIQWTAAQGFKSIQNGD